MADKCFLADAAIMDNMMQLQRKEKVKGKKGKPRAGKVDGREGEGEEEEEAQRLWGMMYAYDAGIVSRSPTGLASMMTVIVTACLAFGLTVPDAKTEIMSLHTEGGGSWRSLSLQPARYTNNPQFCVIGRVFQHRQMEGSASR